MDNNRDTENEGVLCNKTSFIKALFFPAFFESVTLNLLTKNLQ